MNREQRQQPEPTLYAVRVGREKFSVILSGATRSDFGAKVDQKFTRKRYSRSEDPDAFICYNNSRERVDFGYDP